MPVFDTGKITLNYDEGPKSGPPLILLHGLTASKEAWAFIRPRLEKNWHVYAIDLRGHGASGRGDDYVGMDYAGDIIAFLEQLDEPAAVIGHSLGAITTLLVAANAPDRVRAAVLLDPPLYTHNASVKITPGAQSWFSWVYNTVKDDPTDDAVIASVRKMQGPDAGEAQVEGFARYIKTVAPGTVKVALDDRLLGNVDLAAELRRIACPLLLFWGDWDNGSAVRPEDAELVRANVANATIVQIEGGAHQLHVEHADEVWSEIEQFLKQTEE